MSRVHFDPVLPSERDIRGAGELRRAIEQLGTVDTPLRLQIDATAFDLPPLVSQLLADILKETAAGHAISLVPVDTEVTTQQTADLLNVSRPYVVLLVKNGTLPARMVGKHRRLPLRDVLAYKADHFAKRSKVLDDLVGLDQDLGLL